MEGFARLSVITTRASPDRAIIRRPFMSTYDILIVGSGPAGLSAAITARARDKTVAVVSNKRTESGLYKASEIDNYPGFPGISGAELSGKLAAHAQGSGAKIVTGRVIAAVPSKSGVSVSTGSEIYSGRALILATGVAQTFVYPGENEYLGRGVSYCATCDGMLYRGKTVCAVSLMPEGERELDHLRSIGCNVITLPPKPIEIVGDGNVTGVISDGETIACDGVFIFRSTVAAATLLPGLALTDGVIKTDRDMSTNLPGIFAAGDCVGAPRQIAKAVGEGQIAALGAVSYIDSRE
jgi:thioredoxin reductase (NADPH)